MADIIHFEPIGGVSPGYAYQSVEALINAAWNKGLDKEATLTSKMDAATSGFLDTVAAPTITAGTVAGPTLTAPDVDTTAPSVDDVLFAFDDKCAALMDQLVERTADFREKFFPNEAATYEAAESALKEAMLSTNGGLSETEYLSLMESNRSRVLDDASRASDAVLSTFAAVRFPVPPAAALAAVAMIQQKAQGEIAEGSRKLVELSVELRKFNIQQLLTLRGTAMGAVTDYIRTLASSSDNATAIVNAGYAARAKMTDAATEFFRAQISAEDLVSKVGQFNTSAALEAASKNQASQLAMIENKLKALLAEAQVIAQMATSLFNNLNVSVGASGN